MLELHRKGKSDFYDLSSAIVYVAVDENDEPFEMLSARLVWQFEPLMRLRRSDGTFASRATLRRATYLLFMAMQEFVATGPVPIRVFIAFITNRAAWSWVEKLKFFRFPRGRFYGKDLSTWAVGRNKSTPRKPQAPTVMPTK